MDVLSSVSLMFDSSDLVEAPGKIIRNRLNLAQRIEVLKQFSKTPDMGYLAKKFKCGRRQIRNILRKRKKYVTMWTRNKHRYDENIICVTSDSVSALTDAVGFVLQEWVQRAKCYQININDDILRSFGQEIAYHIQYKNFTATDAWLTNFKQKYSLTDLELNIKQEKYFSPQERKPLSISVIIADLRRDYGESAIPTGDDNSSLYLNEDSNLLEVENNVRTGKRDSTLSESSDSGMQLDNDDTNVAIDKPGSSTAFAKEIRDYKEALNQLGPLEQFALMMENVRAVGLINQLENLFRDRLANEL